jgi:hypothetical protein
MDVRVPSVATQVQLPLEITDMITDFLFDDVKALSAMSLVCRAFLPSTRLHLFEDMTIVIDHPYHAESDRSRLDELMVVYISLAPFVRNLLLCALDDDPVRESLNEWLHAAFPLFIVLKGIKSLSVQISWQYVQPETRKGMFACFDALLALSIGHTSFHDPSEIFELILQCPVLERLCLRNITYPTLTFGTPAARQLPCLRIFSIYGASWMNVGLVLNWFLSLDPVPSLHTFRINSITSTQCAIVGSFVRALGTSLKELALEFCCTNEGVLNESLPCICLSLKCSGHWGILFAWSQH